MRSNSWLTVPADDELIFNTDLSRKWDRAMLKMGIDPMILSSDMGHA